MHNSGGNDRRRFLRVPFQRNIKYRLCYERVANEIVDADATNISQNGILFKTKYPPAQGAIIALNVELDKLREYVQKEKLSDVIDVDQIYERGHTVFGEVVRVIEEEHSGFYSVAVQLILKKDPNAQHKVEEAKKKVHPQYIDPTIVADEEKYGDANGNAKPAHPQYIDPSLADEE